MEFKHVISINITWNLPLGRSGASSGRDVRGRNELEFSERPPKARFWLFFDRIDVPWLPWVSDCGRDCHSKCLQVRFLSLCILKLGEESSESSMDMYGRNDHTLLTVLDQDQVESKITDVPAIKFSACIWLLQVVVCVSNVQLVRFLLIYIYIYNSQVEGCCLFSR